MYICFWIIYLNIWIIWIFFLFLKCGVGQIISPKGRLLSALHKFQVTENAYDLCFLERLVCFFNNVP